MPRGPESDAALVERLRAGDEQAFARVVEAHDAPLRRLARSFVRTDALAAEVVQETWLEVVRGLDRFEGRSSLKTWIYSILVNRARTRGQREARQVPFSSLAGADDGPVVAPEAFARDGTWRSPPPALPRDPEGALLARELRGRLSAVIDELPEPHRTVILMRDVAGFDGPEVAEALGISEGNQRVILHRARGRVRARLTEYVSS